MAAVAERISVSRTEDERMVRRVIDHPALIEALSEFGGPLPVPMHPLVYYLIGTEPWFDDGAVEDRLVGLVAFHPVNAITWTPHIAVLPEARGCGAELLRAGVAWMLEHTPCQKFFASPPAYNLAMVRCFKKCGFKREGLSPRSFRWRGAIHDRVLMGYHTGAG